MRPADSFLPLPDIRIIGKRHFSSAQSRRLVGPDVRFRHEGRRPFVEEEAEKFLSEIFFLEEVEAKWAVLDPITLRH